jgi:hypothetical protein
MSASTPALVKNRFVSSGYSVCTRTPFGRSSTASTGESPATATTIRIGRAVAFE